MYINTKIYNYRKMSRIQASRDKKGKRCQLTGSTSGSLLPPQQFPILHRKQKAVEDFSFFYISEISYTYHSWWQAITRHQ
jgi:hypothetical protein